CARRESAWRRRTPQGSCASRRRRAHRPGTRPPSRRGPGRSRCSAPPRGTGSPRSRRAGLCPPPGEWPSAWRRGWGTWSRAG
ncbi:MAG: hypothetical protein FJX74_26505, partial [Armatimonadetes bacterium]|nr:hypothetical protein [Armatimonadota bacterium]